MKTIVSLTFLLLLVSLAGFAQKRNSTQYQMQKELDQLRMQLHQEMKSLHDSLAVLQEQLSELRKNPDASFEFSIPEGSDFLRERPDADWDQSLNFEFKMPKDFERQLPPVEPCPPADFYFQIPREEYLYESRPFEFRFDMPEIPSAPSMPEFYRERNKKDDFLRMLPFYEWFKS